MKCLPSIFDSVYAGHDIPNVVLAVENENEHMLDADTAITITCQHETPLHCEERLNPHWRLSLSRITSRLSYLGCLTRGNLILVVYLRLCRFGLPRSLLASSQAR